MDIDFPNSVLLNHVQRQELKRLWPHLNKSDKKNFDIKLKNEEKILNKTIVELCQKDPSFLKRLKPIRQKRKREILIGVEQKKQKIELKQAEEKIDEL